MAPTPFPFRSRPHAQQERSVRHLRAHFHPAASCAQPQPTEEAVQPPNRKASPASHFQLDPRRPELKEAAALLVMPRQPSNPTGLQSPHPAPTEEGLRHLARPRTESCSSFPLQPSCLRSELKEAAAPLVIPYQPSNSTGQHSPHPEPTAEGLRHLARQRIRYYSSVPFQPSCLRSGPMVAAAPLAIPHQPSNSTGQ